jgi:hypothetical protein
MNYYCVIQSGFAIFGVGTTKRDAAGDAREWLELNPNITTSDLLDILEKGDPRVHGALCILPCSKSVYDCVRRYGEPGCDWTEIGGFVKLDSEKERKTRPAPKKERKTVQRPTKKRTVTKFITKSQIESHLRSENSIRLESLTHVGGVVVFDVDMLQGYCTGRPYEFVRVSGFATQPEKTLERYSVEYLVNYIYHERRRIIYDTNPNQKRKVIKR